MTELYSDADVRAIKRRIKRWRVIVALLTAGELAAAVILAATVSTATEGRNQLIVMISSILVGCVVFYAVNFIILAAKRELGHAVMLKSGSRTRLTGRIDGAGERYIIRKSIAVRKFTFAVRDGEKMRLNVADNPAYRLFRAADAGTLDLDIVSGYVAAFGVAGAAPEAEPKEGGGL